jgi:hypothetical protein
MDLKYIDKYLKYKHKYIIKKFSKLQNTPINIMTYNVHCVPIIHCSKKYIENICNYIKILINKYNIDIIILTECFVEKLHKYLINILNNTNKDWNILKKNEKKHNLAFVNSGILILWKNKLKKLKSYYKNFSKCIDVDCLSNKGMLYTRFVINNKYINIIGVHLQANYKKYMDYEYIQKTQLEDIKQFYLKLRKKKIIKDNEDTIICGDFNITNINIIKKYLNINNITNYYINNNKNLDHFYIISNKKKIINEKILVDSTNPSDHNAIMIKY